jgi:hypothetical protein
MGRVLPVPPGGPQATRLHATYCLSWYPGTRAFANAELRVGTSVAPTFDRVAARVSTYGTPAGKVLGVGRQSARFEADPVVEKLGSVGTFRPQISG